MTGTVPSRKKHHDGTVPSRKKHRDGTVSSRKKHHDGTVPSCKKHHDGTVPSRKKPRDGTVLSRKKHSYGTVPSHKKHHDSTVEKMSGTFHLTHIIQNSFHGELIMYSCSTALKNTYSAKYANSTMSTFVQRPHTFCFVLFVFVI